MILRDVRNGCLIAALTLTACSSSGSTTSKPTVETATTAGVTTSTASTAATTTASTASTTAMTAGAKASTSATTSAAAPSTAFTSADVSFAGANGLTTAATLTTPTAAGKHPAVLFIAGSGQTDRNGDSSLIPGKVGTLRFLAESVGPDAVTLRFDKLGVGTSQVPAEPAAITFEDFVSQAAAARDWLGQQPSVDPSRIVIAGHSEGGLIALAMSSSTPSASTKVALLSPPGGAYLAVIRAQLATQLSADVLVTYDALATELRTTGAIATQPEDRALASVFNPRTWKFLASADRYDPVALAAKLDAGSRVLLTCGERDIQVPCPSLANLRAALASRLSARFTDVELKGTNHVVRTTGSAPGTPETYVNESFPHNPDAAAALRSLITQP